MWFLKNKQMDTVVGPNDRIQTKVHCIKGLLIRSIIRDNG